MQTSLQLILVWRYPTIPDTKKLVPRYNKSCVVSPLAKLRREGWQCTILTPEVAEWDCVRVLRYFEFESRCLRSLGHFPIV